MVDKIPGWQKLLDDCDAVEAMFKQPEFKGEFKMHLWGYHRAGDDHAPQEQNFCGTSACLAGWLGIAGKHEFKAKWVEGSLVPEDVDTYGHSFGFMARQVYGIQSPGWLFESDVHAGLAAKLRDARHSAYQARDREEAKSNG